MQLRRHCVPQMGSYHVCGCMSAEEEVEMLERAKEHAESMLRNINERLEKLRA